MRFLYVSRQFNRSGYHILEHLLDDGMHIPAAVLLPSPSAPQPLDDPARAEEERRRYAEEVARYGGRPLRFLGSIRRLAEDRGIPVFERRGIKSDEAYRWLASLDLDLIAVGGGWHQLFPPRVIDLPRLGVINTHPSLLPEFRGTDIHRWQVLHGVDRSGATIHYVDEGCDTGEILGQVAVPITPNDTPQDLADKAGRAAGPLMKRVLDRIASAIPGRARGAAQAARDDASRYFSRWRWEDREFLRLDWNRPAEDLRRFVLACAQESYRYNGPFFEARGAEYIVRGASTSPIDAPPGRPGDVARIDAEGVTVRCGDDRLGLRLTRVQPASLEGFRDHFHPEPSFPAAQLAPRAGLVPGDSVAATPEQNTLR
jgi:methionyl-tRNA formyltransferase